MKNHNVGEDGERKENANEAVWRRTRITRSSSAAAAMNAGLSLAWHVRSPIKYCTSRDERRREVRETRAASRVADILL